jgi:hypothetical protein
MFKKRHHPQILSSFLLLKVKRLKVIVLYSDTHIVRTAPLSKVGTPQVTMTSGAVHTVAYNRLAPSHPPLQLAQPHAVLVVTLRTLTPC